MKLKQHGNWNWNSCEICEVFTKKSFTNATEVQWKAVLSCALGERTCVWFHWVIHTMTPRRPLWSPKCKSESILGKSVVQIQLPCNMCFSHFFSTCNRCNSFSMFQKRDVFSQEVPVLCMKFSSWTQVLFLMNGPLRKASCGGSVVPFCLFCREISAQKWLNPEPREIGMNQCKDTVVFTLRKESLHEQPEPWARAAKMTSQAGSISAGSTVS